MSNIHLVKFMQHSRCNPLHIASFGIYKDVDAKNFLGITKHNTVDQLVPPIYFAAFLEYHKAFLLVCSDQHTLRSNNRI